MLIAIMLAVVGVTPFGPKTGNIWIRVEPGVQLFLDSAPAGVSDQKEHGKVLENVAPGEHQIEIRTEDGGTRTVKTTVVAAQTAIVSISILGMHGRARADDSDLQFEVT